MQEFVSDKEFNDFFNKIADKHDFDDGNGLVSAQRRMNPDGTIGGWVADTAIVENDVYVGYFARVYGNARVYRNAKVEDNACVYDDSRIFGSVRVYENAKICGKTKLYDFVQVGGNVVLKDEHIDGEKVITF